MSQTVNSGNVVATITLSAASKRTVTPVEGVVNNSATTTVATVGAGKKWTIVGCSLTSSVLGAVTPLCKAMANGVSILAHTVAGSATYPVVAASSQSWAYTDAPVITAGQTLAVSNNAASTVSTVTYQYIEESA